MTRNEECEGLVNEIRSVSWPHTISFCKEEKKSGYLPRARFCFLDGSGDGSIENVAHGVAGKTESIARS